MKHAFLLLFLLSLLAGCSAWISKPTEELLTTTKKPEEAPKKVVTFTLPPEKEPGSLWSEGSAWNELYSVSAARRVGDVVFVRPSDTFRNVVMARGGKILQKTPDSVTGTAQNLGLAVSIKEVLPRNVYRIASVYDPSKPVDEPTVTFAAKVKERDIGDEDVIDSDQLFDMNFNVLQPPPPKEEVRKDDKKVATTAKPATAATPTSAAAQPPKEKTP